MNLTSSYSSNKLKNAVSSTWLVFGKVRINLIDTSSDPKIILRSFSNFCKHVLSRDWTSSLEIN